MRGWVDSECLFTEGEGLLRDRKDGLSERVMVKLSPTWGRLGREFPVVGTHGVLWPPCAPGS